MNNGINFQVGLFGYSTTASIDKPSFDALTLCMKYLLCLPVNRDFPLRDFPLKVITVVAANGVHYTLCVAIGGEIYVDIDSAERGWSHFTSLELVSRLKEAAA